MAKTFETFTVFINKRVRFEVYQDRAQKWRWRCVSRNGQITAPAGQGFASKRNATRAVERFVASVREAV